MSAKGDAMDSLVEERRTIAAVLPLVREVPVLEERESPWVVDVATGRVVRRRPTRPSGQPSVPMK